LPGLPSRSAAGSGDDLRSAGPPRRRKGRRARVGREGRLGAPAQPQSAEAGRMSAIDPLQPRAKVLVVDDEPENVDVVVRALRREYEIVTACDGTEGIRRLDEFVPDLVITDQRMP